MLHVTAARLALNRKDTAAASHALAEAERLGRTSMTDIRRIVQVLRADGDSPLDMPQPTIEQIDELVETYRRAGLLVDATIDPAIRDITESAGMTLYRILQEALTNAARHGDGAATVHLWHDDAAVHLRVRNPLRPGTGQAPPGSGMTGMRERAEAAGGTCACRIESGEWTVEASIPAGEAS